MNATEAYIIAQFAAANMTVATVEFTEEETIVVTLDTGREFMMEVGSDDDLFVFVDTDDEEYEFSFEIPEEGFED